MITLDNLSHTYQGGVQALRGLSFEVPVGALVCIAGVNGCGKSTALTAISGIVPADDGDVFLNGQAADPEERRRACRLMMQNPDMQLIGATVEEDLMLGRRETERDAAWNLLRSLGFEADGERPVHTLSWGMKRKLCLASALMDEPEALLLDEPFSGLDYPGIVEMRRLLSANRRAGLTQLVAAHDLECLADMADVFVLVAEGRAVASGSAEEVFDSLAEHGVRPPCSWRHGRGLEPWEAR